MRETGKQGYQKQIKDKIKEMFPECIVIKNDPNDIQGIPDLTILCPIKWATLETKGSSKAKKQPNQDYYVEKLDNMGFSSFIYPENEKQVLSDLQKHLKN